MFVWNPLRIARKPINNFLIRRVKQVRSVLVNPHAAIMDIIIAIPCYVHPLVDDFDVEAGLRKLSCIDRSGKPRTDHQYSAQAKSSLCQNEVGAVIGARYIKATIDFLPSAIGPILGLFQPSKT